jgi:hypothetical protein
MHRTRLPYLLVPLAAFLAIIPLLANGCSCGHDFDFHLLNWMEAARQFTHGNLHPHWAYTAAWNAGEPRFVFYPPLSWTIGAILGLLLPWTWTPIVYTWLALTAAGLSLHYLARDFSTPTAATLAAILYTVNPYMLFTAYERTAYAELLAATWIPLLLHAILRTEITIPRIAIPIALLWLTNAPAAVMSCYALALVAAVRVATKPGGPYIAVSSRCVGIVQSTTAPTHLSTKTASPQTPLRLALNTAAGTALGLGLAAIYIIPAAYERRYVQIAMAILPGMRIQDNFLFHHTGEFLHDQVLHTASLIAIILITFTAVALSISFALYNSARKAKRNEVGRPRYFVGITPTPNYLLLSLAIITIAITLLLTPLTTIIWNHSPELLFLQFPWRLVATLAAASALAIANALTPMKLTPTSTTALTLIIAGALTYPAYRAFHQTCDEEDTVQARLALFRSNQGSEPTDEYTPITADNDSLAQTNPAYWLSPDANAKAPSNTQAGLTPTHFSVTATQPGFLILNLRDYPSWDVTSTDPNSMHLNHPNHIQRDDGLIVLPIYYAADFTIDIAYTRTFDQTLGIVISLVALAFLALLVFAGRRKKLI